MLLTNLLRGCNNIIADSLNQIIASVWTPGPLRDRRHAVVVGCCMYHTATLERTHRLPHPVQSILSHTRPQRLRTAI